MINESVLKELDKVGVEIFSWSWENFGDNKGMGAIPSLLGVFEEIGEKEEAKSKEDLFDAVGDIAVYLADFVNRDGGLFIQVAPFIAEANAAYDKLSYKRLVFAGAGGLAHAFLKRMQGIRQMDQPELYLAKKNLAIAKLLVGLDATAEAHCDGRSLQQVLAATWNKVKERNWKTNPANADATNDSEPAEKPLTTPTPAQSVAASANPLTKTV